MAVTIENSIKQTDANNSEHSDVPDNSNKDATSDKSADNETEKSSSAQKNGANSEEEKRAKHMEQREYRVRELIESENDYVSDLGQCCQYIEFMRETKEEENPEIPMPPDLKQGKDRMIFGNMEVIYEWHRE